MNEVTDVMYSVSDTKKKISS